MSNMSHCRFINTYQDLQDCYDHMDDNDLSKAETQYRDKLIKMCKDIAYDFGNIEDDFE